VNHKCGILFKRRANLNSRVDGVLAAQDGTASVNDIGLAASASRGDVSLARTSGADVRASQGNISVNELDVSEPFFVYEPGNKFLNL
jgi:hypothetical protein